MTRVKVTMMKETTQQTTTIQSALTTATTCDLAGGAVCNPVLTSTFRASCARFHGLSPCRTAVVQTPANSLPTLAGDVFVKFCHSTIHVCATRVVLQLVEGQYYEKCSGEWKHQQRAKRVGQKLRTFSLP